MAGDLLQRGLERAGQAATSFITGEPIPGSDEAKQRQIVSARLDQALKEIKSPKQGETAEEYVRRLKLVNSALLDQHKGLSQVNLENARELIPLRGELEQFQINRGKAETDNQINLLGAKTDRQRQIVADLASQELRLADHDAGAMDKVLAFYGAAQDKNLQAQRDANSFGSKIPGLLGGLLAAAAAFA
jgi:hypothetical protein